MRVAAAAPTTQRDRILVWVDGREACIVRGGPEGPSVERRFADEPAQPHPTGHLRHNPALRHGEEWKSGADRRRERQLETFLAEVEGRLEPDADVLLIGPGPVHERLARRLIAADARHRSSRAVSVAAASRMTVRQLQARWRQSAEET